MPRNKLKYKNGNTDSTLATSEEDSLEVNTGESNGKACVHVSSPCKTESQHKDSNKIFETLVNLKEKSGTAITNDICVYKGTRCSLNSGYDCRHLVLYVFRYLEI